MEACLSGRQYEAYVKANEQLELILKGMSDYLEKKRLEFPKFFFFANDDLSYLLSRKKSPLELEPYLHKCFEGINKLNTNSDQLAITGITSEDGETLLLASPINLIEYPDDLKAVKQHRKVEYWLSDLESEIKITLQKSVKAEFISPSQTVMSMLMEDPMIAGLPEQIKQAINQVLFTRYAEKAIQDGKLKEAEEEYMNILQAIIKDMKIHTQSSQKVQRRRDILILNMHNQEVLHTLYEAEVKDAMAFEWQAQMRYYCSLDKKLNHIPVECRILNASRFYGYDYILDTSRLIVTPLTLRCYRSLMNALSIYCGGASEGPAGVGKTETTKDLGKALGKSCMVFSGSGVLTTESFTRLFKGVASSGIWLCIEEFNKIQLEVLSVVSQYVQSILKSLQNKATSIDINESTTYFNTSCGVFITLHPGNQHFEKKNDIPESLRISFRSVSMIAPDKLKIAETYLSVYGFTEAKNLANALVTTMDVAKESLGSEIDYDFSMRTYKTILKKANKMLQEIEMKDQELAEKESKKENAEEKKKLTKVEIVIRERLILMAAINSMFTPRLRPKDMLVFSQIMIDQFPKLEDQKQMAQELLMEPQINLSLSLYNLQYNSAVISKLNQLYDAIQMRSGVILLGEPFCGKSVLLEVVRMAITLKDPIVFKIVNEEIDSNNDFEERLLTEEKTREYMRKINKMIKDAYMAMISPSLAVSNLSTLPKVASPNNMASKAQLPKENEPKPNEIPQIVEEKHTPLSYYIHLHQFIPQSIASQRIFGVYDSMSGQWKEGILPAILRKAIHSSPDIVKHWLLLDGELSQEYMENLYSALDESHKLCLSNSESLIIPNEFKFFFETSTIANATPATISRCGIVSFDCASQNALQGSTIFTYNDIFESWIKSLPPKFKTHYHIELYQALKRELLDPFIILLCDTEKKGGSKNCTWNLCSLIYNFLHLYESLLFNNANRTELEIDFKKEQNIIARREAYEIMGGLKKREESSPRAKRAATLSTKIIVEYTAHFMQAIVWSIIFCLNEHTHQKAMRYLLQKFMDLKVTKEASLEYLKESAIAYPSEGAELGKLIFNREKGMWGTFSDHIPRIDYSKKAEPCDLYSHNLIIQTEDSFKYQQITKLLIEKNHNILLIGEPNSGKSLILRELIQREFKGEDTFVKIISQFSGKTTAGYIQEQVENKCERRVKNLYSPKNIYQRILVSIGKIYKNTFTKSLLLI